MGEPTSRIVSPTITKYSNRRLSIEWPHGRDGYVLVSPAVVEGYVDTINCLLSEIEELQREKTA